jgi:outer membrane PBP1 activator LpoA protein
MRIRHLLAVLLTAVIPLQLPAQQNDDTAAINAAIEMERQITETERQLIVAQNLQLTDTQSDEFWPKYRDYRTDVAKLNDRFIHLVRQYAANYQTLTDKEAIVLTKDALKLEADRVKLQQRYVNRFDKIIGGKNTARYLQIEARLDAIMTLKVRSSIPLVM